MSYLFVNLYQHHPNESFDVDRVLKVFKDSFADLQVGSDDPLLVRAENAKSILTGRTEAERAVLSKLQQDAAEQGPARTFWFSLEGVEIHGVVKRQLLQLTHAAPVSEAAIARVVCIIRSAHSLGSKMVVERS